MKFFANVIIWSGFLVSLLIAQDVDRYQQQTRLQQIRKEIEGGLSNMKGHPYGTGDASEKIIDILSEHFD